MTTTKPTLSERLLELVVQHPGSTTAEIHERLALAGRRERQTEDMLLHLRKQSRVDYGGIGKRKRWSPTTVPQSRGEPSVAPTRGARAAEPNAGGDLGGGSASGGAGETAQPASSEDAGVEPLDRGGASDPASALERQSEHGAPEPRRHEATAPARSAAGPDTLDSAAPLGRAQGEGMNAPQRGGSVLALVRELLQRLPELAERLEEIDALRGRVAELEERDRRLGEVIARARAELGGEP